MGITFPRTIFLIPLGIVKGTPITLPFADRMVSLGLDGQYVNLDIDTGTPHFFAIYGPEFEKQNGKGSCKNRLCYFCPLDNPCDDILERKRWRVAFGDGSVYTLVEHTVSLTIGELTITNFKIGLAITCYGGKCKRVKGNIYWLLGLSHGYEGISETFLEQLKKLKVISSLKYWVRADQDTSSFDGNLILDDSTRTDSHRIDLHRGQHSTARRIWFEAWPLQLLSSQGNLVTPRSSLPKRGALMGVDSGASHIFVSSADFNTFLEGSGKYVWRRKAALWVNKKESF